MVKDTYVIFRHRFLRRLKNRLKYVLDFKTIWNWEYESCERCGSCFRLAYTLKNEAWDNVYGSSNGCLCLNCFLEKGAEKNFFIAPSDFEWLALFNGDGPIFDIINIEEK